MLVGDAARQANPITGGGIVQAMLAGKYAGEVAAKAVKQNNTSKKVLNQYKDMYFKHLGDNQKFMYSLKRKFVTWDDDRFNSLCAMVRKIPATEFSLFRLFQESIKEDPAMLASLATSFIVSKIKK
jgi:digeranylgeranylglycerophospholipid reductase